MNVLKGTLKVKSLKAYAKDIQIHFPPIFKRNFIGKIRNFIIKESKTESLVHRLYTRKSVMLTKVA